jgi:8-oxo-dGTP pyrophosphatase MutT (NUDIX family)
MSTSSLSTLRSFLDRRLTEPLPGTEAQLEMAPAYRMEPEQAQVSGKHCREAAVLALVHPHEQGLAVLLTVRCGDLHDHAGQVSFPGGSREAGEAHRRTALREAQEETGLPPDAVTLHGALTPLFVPPTAFCVYPFVGTAATPVGFTPDPREVDRIVHAPLARLLDPEARCCEPWDLHGTTVMVPYFDIAGCTVWGATAMMLAELVAILHEAPQLTEQSATHGPTAAPARPDQGDAR